MKGDTTVKTKLLMCLDVQYGALSDKCGDCLFCLTRGHNHDQKSCLVTGFIVNPAYHDYRCPASFEVIPDDEVATP